MGLKELFFTQFYFNLVFSPEPNKRKFHFLLYFPLFLFYHLYFHGLRENTQQ